MGSGIVLMQTGHNYALHLPCVLGVEPLDSSSGNRVKQVLQIGCKESLAKSARYEDRYED